MNMIWLLNRISNEKPNEVKTSKKAMEWNQSRAWLITTWVHNTNLSSTTGVEYDMRRYQPYTNTSLAMGPIGTTHEVESWKATEQNWWISSFLISHYGFKHKRPIDRTWLFDSFLISHYGLFHERPMKRIWPFDSFLKSHLFGGHWQRSAGDTKEGRKRAGARVSAVFALVVAVGAERFQRLLHAKLRSVREEALINDVYMAPRLLLQFLCLTGFLFKEYNYYYYCLAGFFFLRFAAAV